MIPEGNIFNGDESGFTICHTPGHILVTKGKRGIGALTSADKGKNVTIMACFFSAIGEYFPPIMIFPRVRIRPELFYGSPLFECWFDHFVEAVHPSHRIENVLLIIIDGHSSHTKNTKVIYQARNNNVVIISLPSHCKHNLQPLDVSLFKSVNANYNIDV